MKTKALALLALVNALVSTAVACGAEPDPDPETAGDAISGAPARATTFETTPTDRIGRPAISAVVLNMTAEVDEKDTARIDHVKWFDELDSFGGKDPRIAEEITKGLGLMDRSDGHEDFTAEEAAAWVDHFKEDALVVDVSKPCGVEPDPASPLDSTHSYLDIEKEAVDKDHTHATCGGRTPKDDTVDIFMTFAITHKDWHPGAKDWKTTPEHLGDGIDNASAATNEFPYLAAPHPLSIPSVPIPDSVDLGTGKLVTGDFSELVEASARGIFGEALRALWNKILAALGLP